MTCRSGIHVPQGHLVKPRFCLCVLGAGTRTTEGHSMFYHDHKAARHCTGCDLGATFLMHVLLVRDSISDNRRCNTTLYNNITEERCGKFTDVISAQSAFGRSWPFRSLLYSLDRMRSVFDSLLKDKSATVDLVGIHCLKRFRSLAKDAIRHCERRTHTESCVVNSGVGFCECLATTCVTSHSIMTPIVVSLFVSSTQQRRSMCGGSMTAQETRFLCLRENAYGNVALLTRLRTVAAQRAVVRLTALSHVGTWEAVYSQRTSKSPDGMQ